MACVDVHSVAYFLTDDRAARLAAAEAASTKVLSLAPNHAIAQYRIRCASKSSPTAPLKASPNASVRWRWIGIWPPRTRLIGVAKYFIGRGRGNRKPYP